MKSHKKDKPKKERIVILNAAINTEKRSGKAKVALYKLASVFGEFRNAKIINLNGRGGNNLSDDEEELLRNATRVVVLGHSKKERKYLTTDDDLQQQLDSGKQLDPGKLVGILKHTSDKLDEISIVACESIAFGDSLSQMIAGINDDKSKHLKKVPVTAQTHIAIPNPFTGKVYSLSMTNDKLQVFSGGETHKAKFKIEIDEKTNKEYSSVQFVGNNENKKINKPLTFFFRMKEKFKSSKRFHKEQKKDTNPKNHR